LQIVLREWTLLSRPSNSQAEARRNCHKKGLSVRVRDSYLSKFYWKLKQRRGAKKAIIALARKILVIVYNLLKNSDDYNELKFEATKQKQESMRLRKLSSDAKKLGFNLVQIKTAA